MLIPVRTTQFKRDVKLSERRGCSLPKLVNVMEKLAKEEPLDPNFKDHKLGGDYKNHRECPIEPDWLLIYKISDTEITYVRTGTHSDLFKK